MPFTLPQKILFEHCDPAGSVFYPRYFEMINDCVEALFDSNLNYPFEKLLTIGRLPAARINTIFTAPSRHGETIHIELSCSRLGHASVDFKIAARCNEETRFTAESTRVFVNKAGKPESWLAARPETGATVPFRRRKLNVPPDNPPRELGTSQRLCQWFYH